MKWPSQGLGLNVQYKSIKFKCEPWLSPFLNTGPVVLVAGEGILVSADATELLQFIDKSRHAHILQKYIEQPLLLPGNRKFDIRWYIPSSHSLVIPPPRGRFY